MVIRNGSLVGVDTQGLELQSPEIQSTIGAQSQVEQRRCRSKGFDYTCTYYGRDADNQVGNGIDGRRFSGGRTTYGSSHASKRLRGASPVVRLLWSILAGRLLHVLMPANAPRSRARQAAGGGWLGARKNRARARDGAQFGLSLPAGGEKLKQLRDEPDKRVPPAWDATRCFMSP